jgi:hypothetical protein
MAVSLVVNGTTYAFPQDGDESGWGAAATQWAQAVTSGMLQKAGGAFTLTAEVDFGASFGLRSTYYRSRATNAASAGAVRLGNDETVAWRNAANSADLSLKVNASNVLEFAGNPLLTLALGAGNAALVMNAGGTAYQWAAIVDANISGSAAIARTKLASGSASHVLVNDGSGNVSSEAQLATSRGGTGVNSTATFPTSGIVATEAYVQSVAQGLDPKGSAQCATTANITLSGEQTIDGVATSASRVLVKNQSTASQNGVYVSAAGSWTRATDMDVWSEVPGAFVFVEQGTVNGDTGWVCTADAGGTIGSTNIPWSQFIGAGTYTAGAGLVLTGTQFSLSTSANLGTPSAAVLTNATGLPLTTGVTGLLPLANLNTSNGPANTTLFNALDPLTTKGDVLTHNGTDSIRLGVGVNGQSLVADSTTASGLTWRESGGGVGVNFLQTNGIEWSFEATANLADPAGWVKYSNGAALPPTTFAVGSPNVDWTFQGTTTTPLYGSVSGLLTKTANNRQGHGIATNVFNITQGSTNDVNYISFNFEFISGSIASGDLVMYVLDVTNSTLIAPSLVNMPTGGKGKVNASFLATASTQYRLYFHQATTSATAYTLELDQIVLGPGQALVAGGVVEQNINLTGFSLVNVPNSGFTASGTRIGQWLQLQATATITGAATGNISLQFPANLTIDSSILPATPDIRPVGQAFMNDLSGSVRFMDMAAVVSSTLVQFFPRNDSGPWSAARPVNPWQNGDTIQISVKVPISQWAGSSVGIGANDVEYAWNSSTSTSASDTTSFAYGPQGAQIQNITAQLSRRIRFQTPVQSGDQISLEVSDNQINWLSIGDASFVNNQNVTRFITENTTSYGLGYDHINATDMDISFGTWAGMFGKTTVGGAGQAWSAGAGAAFWRVKKTAAGIPVGFGAATATQSGLVSTTTQNFGGVKTFNDGVRLDDDTGAGGATVLSYYREVLHATTWQANAGGSASASVNIRITRIGNVVTLTIPTVTVASGTGAVQFGINTLLPSWAIPSAAVMGYTIISFSGAVSANPSPFFVRTSGDIQVIRDNISTAFANGVTAVFCQGPFGGAQTTISYSVA